MKSMIKAALLATAPLSLLAVSAVSATAQTKSGIAVVDLNEAGSKSTAFTTAMSQIQTKFAAQLAQIKSRQAAINADLQAKDSALKAAIAAAGQNSTPAQQTALQGQYETLRKTAAAGESELQNLGQPIALAQEYARAQVATKLDQALKAAMAQSKAEVVLNEDATASYTPAVSITAAVTAQLNAILPSVSITPPAGWQPGQPIAGGSAAPAPSGGR